jgi:hypothetical protein
VAGGTGQGVRLMGRENGYFKSGSDHPRAKLTEAAVRKIIADPRSYSKIAAEHDIAMETVAALKQGRGWKHLPRNPPLKTQLIRKGNVLVVTQKPREDWNWVRGEAHCRARLKEPQILAIRRDSRSESVIAASYGVSKGCIHSVKTRRTWRWLRDGG